MCAARVGNCESNTIVGAYRDETSSPATREELVLVSCSLHMLPFLRQESVLTSVG